MNQLGAASSARDRLNIGYFTWNPVDQIIQEPTLLVRYNDLKVIAGVMQISLPLGTDPEFITQYEKVAFSKLRFIMGAEAERIIAELGTIQPSMVNFLRNYIQGTK